MTNKYNNIHTTHRILSLTIAVLLLTLSALSLLCLPASAAEGDVGVSSLPADFCLKQTTNYTCTLCCEVNMMRYAYYLMGKSYGHTPKATQDPVCGPRVRASGIPPVVAD